MNKKLISMAIIAIFGFIILCLGSIVEFLINVQWFRDIGYLSVYFTRIVATLKLMCPIFVVCFVGIYFYFRSLKRSIERWRNTIDVTDVRNTPKRKAFLILDFIISFIISYIVSYNYWYRILQFTNSTAFGVSDPIFKRDVSFYVFKLPLIQSLFGAIMLMLIFLIIITLIMYLFMNVADRVHIRDIKESITNRELFKSGITKFAGKQLAVLSALILLFLSLGYLLKSWNLVYSPRGVVFGASYTDEHVTLVFFRIIAVVSVIASVVISISVLTSRFKTILASISIIIFLIIGEVIASAAVQNFIVKSNEKSLEQKYIKYNIEYTKRAFNLDGISESKYPLKESIDKKSINQNKDTVQNIKINSFGPALEFYNQVQVIRNYYSFNDIDVDRYELKNKYNQVFIAPREIDLNSIETKTWQNKHLIYTHGYGVVMSKVNSVTPEGQPDFVIKDIPPDNLTKIKFTDPRIYFGEKTNDYAIVNTQMNEFDYPQGGSNQTNKYKGKSGIKMTFLNRLLFSIKERNLNFLLSRDISSDSKILINRNIVDRANKIAPFLKYDKDPYVVINNGKLYWIIDAYTVTNQYPFSQPIGNINYIRNSVKVVVDAVEGSVDFYICDKNDPIIKSYSKIFPKLFKDISLVDNGLKQHFRYPQDIFNIQCKVLGKYHVNDAGIFYNGEDLWEVAKNDKRVEGQRDKGDATYMIMKLPNQSKEEMILLDYFNMINKDNMVALFGARMDNDNYGKLVLYKFPTQKTIYSPYLFKQKLKQDTSISKELTLWNKEGSKVLFGDTIVVPIDNCLLYIEPLYLRAQGKNSIPEMKRIVVSYGDKIVLAENMSKALEQLFNYNEQDTSNDGASAKLSKDDDTILDANKLYNEAISAQKNGDWAKYGEYINKLGQCLKKLSK